MLLASAQQKQVRFDIKASWGEARRGDGSWTRSASKVLSMERRGDEQHRGRGYDCVAVDDPKKRKRVGIYIRVGRLVCPNSGYLTERNTFESEASLGCH